MVVGDEELEGGEAAFLEALEEVAPVDLGFAQGDADAEDGALAIGADPEGDEHGAIEHAAAVADFFVAGIEEDVRESRERAGAPGFQIGVEKRGTMADVSGAHGGAAEFFEDGGDLPGGDALDIHFGECELEGLLTAHALFESRGVELDVAADLRDGKSDVAEAGLESLGFEAVGVAETGVGALERLCLEHMGALGLHGFVDEQAEALGKAVGTFVIEELQHGLEELRMIEAGHVWFWFGVFETPQPEPMWPALYQTMKAATPLRERLRFGSLRSPSLRRSRGGGGLSEGRAFYRKTFTPPKRPALPRPRRVAEDRTRVECSTRKSDPEMTRSQSSWDFSPKCSASCARLSTRAG